MKNKIGDSAVLRDYLLGLLKDDPVLSRIEKQLISDDEVADMISTAENELIEDYLDGALGTEESRQFARHFLASPERKQQLRLTKNLRKYSMQAEAIKPVKRGLFDWAPTLSIQWLRFAALAVVIAAAGLGIWRFAIYESDTDKGLVQLRRAFDGQRLIEPRITVLPDYAPYSVTRGANARLTDSAAHDRAERYLLDATQDAGNANAHYALSLLNFADKKYERAVQELELALAAAPRDARIQSDAGAIYLELGKLADDDKNGGKKYEYLNESLKHLDLAISIDPKMPEPRFNRALCLMALSIPERAKEAWKEYLAIDPDSKWADEARRHLETLDKTQPRELSADDLESEFLAATKAGDENLAAQLIGTNRELIRDKYLPQRLAASYASAPDERRDEMLRALRYAGEIELKQTGDSFANEIALFYSSLSIGKFALASQAHAEVRDGYSKCLNQEYGASLASFKSAKEKFEEVGDQWNAALADYFVGYALTNSENSTESLTVLTKVQNYAQQRGYLWLDATVSYWIGGVNQQLQRHTSARLSYSHALGIAEKINDGYAAQRNLIELARLSAFVGQESEAFTSLSKMFHELDRQNNSQRQRYRNYATAVEMLSRLRLFNVAKDLSFASMTLADGLEDRMWMSESRGNAGSTMMELGEYENARMLIDGARVCANNITDAGTRRKLLARAAAKSGELETKLGDFDRSAASYRDAVSYYDSAEMPFYPEDAHKGLLASVFELGQTSEVESQIQSTLNITESYRSRIHDPQEQRNYFDLRAGIYEMAGEFEAKRGNYEAAYNYSESANARTLLNSLRTADIKHTGSDPSEFDRPLKLAEVQSLLPANVQLLQYTVLPERILIWIVTKDKFTMKTVEINSSVLDREVGEFVHLIFDRKDGEISERARSLYNSLIEPVKAELDPAKELAIIPNKVLFGLPYAALISSDGNPLVGDFAITYSPSASVYIRCSEIAAKKNQSQNEAFLGVGDPAFDRETFDSLPYLSSAVDEVQTSAAGYNSKEIFNRERATKTAFLNASMRADVIHFAGHYVVTPGDPMSSYMLFAHSGDGPEGSMLANRELAKHSLPRTKLIVLAACQTGVETVYEGEGMAGLASTFLAAKVPLVVASNWSVDSAATTRLMNRFHEMRAKRHLSTAQALRNAQIEILNDPSRTFANPFYWAGFAVFGGHAGY